MNLIFIHTHDTGRIISPYGYKIDTPNYEKLFNDSLIFNNAFSVAPTCSPSRSGLLTGLYPHQNGMLGLAQRGFELDTDKHLARYLSLNGFTTVLCGVQHEYMYYTDHDLAYKKLGYQFDISSDALKYKEEDLVYWDNENASNLVNWLDEYSEGKPFFVSFGMHSTHRKFPEEIDESIDEDESIPPYFINNNKISRNDFARYKTSAKFADENLGKVINKLKEKNLYEKTIILVTTDHGIAYPFGKSTLSDRGIGVLLSMRVPNSIMNKKVFDGLISHIDIFPTICDLLGLKKPDYLQGNSFYDLFNGLEFKGDSKIFATMNFHTSYEPIRCIRTEKYKYIRYFDEEYMKLNISNIDDSEYKKSIYENGLDKMRKEKEYLFDIKIDPSESINLVSNSDYKDILEQFREELSKFMVKTNDPLLNGEIKIKEKWKVNKKTCYSPSSKNPDDYVSVGERQNRFSH